MKRNLGFIALLLSALIFAADGVFIRQLSQNFGNYTISFLRFGIAFCVVLLITTYKRTSLKVAAHSRRSLAVFSLSYLFAFVSFTVSIVDSKKVSNAVFMMLSGALITTLLYGTLVLKEKLNHKKISAIVLALIGISCIAYPFTFDESLALALLAGILFGIANSYRKVIGGINYYTIFFYQFLLATVIAFILTIIFQENIAFNLNYKTALSAILYGLSTVLSGYLVTYGFNNFEVNTGQIILTTELFFAILLNFLFLNEIPTGLEAIGAVVIFLATVISKYSD